MWCRLLKSTKIFYILQYSGEPFRSAKPCLGYRPDHITVSSQPHTAWTFFVFMIRVWILNPILSQSNRSQFNCNESFQRINADSPRSQLFPVHRWNKANVWLPIIIFPLPGGMQCLAVAGTLWTYITYINTTMRWRRRRSVCNKTIDDLLLKERNNLLTSHFTILLRNE